MVTVWLPLAVPAPLVALTTIELEALAVPNVYVAALPAPDRVQPVGAAGNVEELIPDSGSETVTVKLPEPVFLK